MFGRKIYNRLFISLYIYIYIERERERERDFQHRTSASNDCVLYHETKT